MWYLGAPPYCWQGRSSSSVHCTHSWPHWGRTREQRQTENPCCRHVQWSGCTRTAASTHPASCPWQRNRQRQESKTEREAEDENSREGVRERERERHRHSTHVKAKIFEGKAGVMKQQSAMSSSLPWSRWWRWSRPASCSGGSASLQTPSGSSSTPLRCHVAAHTEFTTSSGQAQKTKQYARTNWWGIFYKFIQLRETSLHSTCW